ncbi:MAG: DUF4386 domain-containing protein [Acidimicrobiales bacterium]
MSADRRTARIVGALFLAAMASYMIGDALVESVLDEPDQLAGLSTSSSRFAAGGVFMLLNSVAVIGIGVMVFPILERHSPRVAIGYFGTRLVEGIVLVVGVISLLSLLTLSQSEPAVTGSAASTWAVLAVGINDVAFQIAMFALGLGSLAFCGLLYRVELVPRWLAAWGFVGYAALLAGGLLEIFGHTALLTLSIPGGLFELVFPLWLIGKGFNAPAERRRTEAMADLQR